MSDLAEESTPTAPTSGSGNVKKASTQKWGAEVIKIGYSIVPSLLLRAQRRLGINPTQLAILMQIGDFWWDEGRKPFPRKEVLSERLGIKERQVQRHVAELEKAGLVRRISRFDSTTGARSSNYYDLSGLVSKLQELAPEFAKVDEENQKRRRDVERPMGRRKSSEATPAATPKKAVSE